MGVRFKTWQKATLALLSAALPLTLAARNLIQARPSEKYSKVVLFEELMRLKMEELSDNDLHLATVRKEMLKFEEHRRQILSELTTMRDQISQLVEAESADMSGIPDEDDPSQAIR